MEDGKAFERSLEVQAMLVQQDPACQSSERIGDLDQKTFKRILGAVNDCSSTKSRTAPWRRHCVFSNRRAAAVLLPSRRRAAVEGLSGRAKERARPVKDWAFKDDVKRSGVHGEDDDGRDVPFKKSGRGCGAIS